MVDSFIVGFASGEVGSVYREHICGEGMTGVPRNDQIGAEIKVNEESEEGGSLSGG